MKSLFVFLAIIPILSFASGGGSTGGGGGTPGGSSGQVQYNNSGAFGGFTASGDCTINTGTGAVTCSGKADNQTTVSVSSNVTLTSNARHYVNTSSARSLTLPSVSTSKCIEIKDITGSASSNNITIVRDTTNRIEGISASKVLSTDFGAWRICPDGTDWWLQ